MGVRPQRDAKGAGETKIGKLEVALLVNEEVLGLEVAVEHSVRVAVVQALDELVAELLWGCQLSHGGCATGRHRRHPATG